MNHIGLFAGIGGFELAARWMGWQTIALCENNPFCQKVLGYHFPNATAHGDIKTTDFTIYRGQCDLLTGGFPCQPFSVAGQRKGTEDTRHLWPSCIRAVREVQPCFVVAENVPGLVNWNGGMVFNQVQTDLENEGYEVTPFLLPAAGINAPHKRERIWFIAYSDECRRRRDRRREESDLSAYYQENRSGIFSNPERFSSIRVDTDTGSTGQQERNDPGFAAKPGYGTGPSITQWADWPTQSPVCNGNDGLSSRLAGITVSKHRNESIKGGGNAIVPGVAFQIYKAIDQFIKQHSISKP